MCLDTDKTIKQPLFWWQGHVLFHCIKGCFLLCGVARTHSATQEVSSTAPPFSFGSHLTRQWWKLLTVLRSTKPCGEVIIRTAFLALSFPFFFCSHCSSQRAARRRKTALTIFPYARLVKILKTWPFFFFFFPQASVCHRGCIGGKKWWPSDCKTVLSVNWWVMSNFKVESQCG